jgi:hypothetical protein
MTPGKNGCGVLAAREKGGGDGLTLPSLRACSERMAADPDLDAIVPPGVVPRALGFKRSRLPRIVGLPPELAGNAVRLVIQQAEALPKEMAKAA